MLLCVVVDEGKNDCLSCVPWIRLNSEKVQFFDTECLEAKPPPSSSYRESESNLKETQTVHPRGKERKPKKNCNNS
jgi:hypothetical protein